MNQEIKLSFGPYPWAQHTTEYKQPATEHERTGSQIVEIALMLQGPLGHLSEYKLSQWKRPWSFRGSELPSPTDTEKEARLTKFTVVPTGEREHVSHCAHTDKKLIITLRTGSLKTLFGKRTVILPHSTSTI